MSDIADKEREAFEAIIRADIKLAVEVMKAVQPHIRAYPTAAKPRRALAEALTRLAAYTGE